MDKKFVVTIGREFGTGGRQIAVELAKIFPPLFGDAHASEKILTEIIDYL